MERDYLQKILEGYADSRLDTVYSEEQYKDEELVLSKRYQRRMKKLLWNEKYFGTHIQLGYAVRRVAVAGIVVLSLATANVVSAKVFGFNPWETVVHSMGDLYETHFVKQKDVSEAKSRSGEIAERTREVPAYIPAGYERTESKGKWGEVIWSKWEKDGNSISYLGDVIREDMNVTFNGEYKSKEKLSIAGYEAEYQIFEDCAVLVWNDTEYLNSLDATGISKEEMIRIAESIYEKGE